MPLACPSVFLFTHKELKQISADIDRGFNYTLLTYAVSLLGIAFYKQLPLLKRYPRWWVRLPVSLAMLLAPGIFVNSYVRPKYEQLADTITKRKQRRYNMYIVTGDLRDVNRDCVLEDLPEE